jgi:hypothetical protein
VATENYDTTYVVSDPWFDELGARVIAEQRAAERAAAQDKEAQLRRHRKDISRRLAQVLLQRLEVNVDVPEECIQVRIGMMLFTIGERDRFGEDKLTLLQPCRECGDYTPSTENIGSRKHLGAVLQQGLPLCGQCYTAPAVMARGEGARAGTLYASSTQPSQRPLSPPE